MSFKIKLLITSLLVFISSTAFANFHEVELHSTRALLSFSDGSSIDMKGNYMYFLNDDWQLLFGGSYEKTGDLLTQTGVTIGGVYNFGAPDHNEKYYVKPQLTYASNEFNGFRESGLLISGVIGKRIPIFKNDSYCINYTPAIGVSIPVTNTDAFDTTFSISLIGLSLVFK